MTFDLEMIRSVYERFPKNVGAAREMTGKNLTLAEKILYTHLWEGEAKQAFTRGADYVDFAPDRVAMQDATAQMALLQFMQAGKAKAAVPSTVHCDHLIQAKAQADSDLQEAIKRTTRSIISWNRCPTSLALAFGSLEEESSTRWFWRIMLSREE
jgi:aconitate hydratase